MNPYRSSGRHEQKIENAKIDWSMGLIPLLAAAPIFVLIILALLETK